MSLIRIENLKKSFYSTKIETPVLKGIDLTIERGEFISIIGKSGTGKSTLLYQMGLLDFPTSGKVYIDGTDMSECTRQQRTNFRLRNFGFVFQDYALLPELTALENVVISQIAMGIAKNEAYINAENSMRYFDIHNLKNKYPSQLSGGENQRVAIARAISHKPRIIFADEPTANLDEGSSEPVINIFSQLYKAGNTVIMVTHELDYARTAKRIIHLKNGQVDSDEIIDHSKEQSEVQNINPHSGPSNPLGVRDKISYNEQNEQNRKNFNDSYNS